MTKRLILIAITVVGLLSSEVADAKVCQLGEPDCDTTAQASSKDGVCSPEYHTCSDPRAGSAYCQPSGGEALYKSENCCSDLISETSSSPYKECPADENQIGYGKSCLGANTHKVYWQYCGCAYGFVDTDPDGSTVNSTVGEITDENGEAIPYVDRCSVYPPDGSQKCKLALCNEDRRWFYLNDGEHCSYRLATRCGGFGCMQLYDCNNEEKYYRSEELLLNREGVGEVDNFILYSETDPWSNEKNKNKRSYKTGNSEDPEYRYYSPANVEIPYAQLINGYDKATGTYNAIRYNVTNRIVCSYEGNSGTGTDLSGGKDCNGIKSYCYLWTGCNNVRGWYNNSLNIGVLYGVEGEVYPDYQHPGAYEYWMNEVERGSGYSYNQYLSIPGANALSEGLEFNSINHALRNNFYIKVGNAGAGKYDEVTGQTLSNCASTGGVCEIRNPNGGCTYITHSCHEGSRECFKRISCSEENRFYHSFINAAGIAYLGGGDTLSELPTEEDLNVLYKSSLNGMYWQAFYKASALGAPAGLKYNEIYPACIYEINACNDTANGGIYGGGCYRKAYPKKGCIDNFEDIRLHETIEEDWTNWFKDWRPICNDATRCYQASACDLEGGSYSSEPNTSFFITIHSTATMSTCYRGANCHIEAGAYSSVPNSSFFQIIHSSATGSLCYRGQNCNIPMGAYSSTPNTSFFLTITSEASGSISYRAEQGHIAAGAYSSTPNTSFFLTITSEASGSTSYRAEQGHIAAGAYSSTPNTSFFTTITSEASGSTAYRAEKFCEDCGAYSSTPNTSFFLTITSEASGSTSYRAEQGHIAAGAYSSTPNTSFFLTITSEASGSTAYRAEQGHIAIGAYSSTPNTSFFEVVKSLASGSTSYRGQNIHEAAGAYSSEPNTSFFMNITSEASGSTSYRSENCHIEAGAYSSMPNTFFFVTVFSGSSGSICYRGAYCEGLETGAYTSSPNTSFFSVIESLASGSTCYRGQDCSESRGAYTSSPNTSFFKVAQSSASGSMCYRADSCNFEAGAYSSTPNTSFFKAINSLASGSTCYRGQNCTFEGGAYSSTPNTVFFIPLQSIGSGSDCYRGQECSETANAVAETSFFIFVNSQASGSTCYRSISCRFEAGAYSSIPNTSFFSTITSINAVSDSTCYRAGECNFAGGAYSSAPNTSFFAIVSSEASGSTSYRGDQVNLDAGAYTSTPNTSFFKVLTSEASGSTSYRGEESHLAAGAYSSAPNTSFFSFVSSEASGSISYRGDKINIESGTYSSTPNTSFFKVITSEASGSTAYRAEETHVAVGAYTSSPNTSFFKVINSSASGSTSYRGEESHLAAGAYSSAPNTSFFTILSSEASGSISYRGDQVNLDAGAYTSTPNTSFFKVLTSEASGSTSYRGEESHLAAGAYSSAPNTSFFAILSSEASGSISYRGDQVNLDAGAYTSTPNTSFFKILTSEASGSTAYRGQESHLAAGAYSSAPNTSFFSFVRSLASGSISYRGDKINDEAGAYVTSPNTSFFSVITSEASGSTSYRADDIHASAGSYSDSPNTSFFEVIKSFASGSTSYRGQNSHTKAGAYSSTPNTSFFDVIKSLASGSTSYRGQNSHAKAGAYSSSPNTSFFTTISSEASGSTAYRADDVRTNAGAYSESPNTLFFITISSSASGSTAYRAESRCDQCGAYSSAPNTSFFITIYSLASGSEAYRGQESHLAAGAYSSSPNTLFFNVVTSSASGSISYRADGLAEDAVGAYTSEPNTSFFAVDKSLASGSIAYRGKGLNLLAGVYTSSPNTSFFFVISSSASGSTAYRGQESHTKAGAYSSAPNTSFFEVIKSLASGSTSYRGQESHLAAGAYSSAPNTSFFSFVRSLASGSISYRGDKINDEAGAYVTSPNTSFFSVITSEASGSTSYRADNIHTLAGSYSDSPNTSFFEVIKSLASGSTSYRGQNSHTKAGAYSSEPNTSFFTTITSEASGSTAYRADGFRIEAGAYTSSPNTLFFITITSEASGSTVYRAESYAPGAYSSSPNTSFFAMGGSLASGSTAYRATDAHILAGAYTSSPNTSFFFVIKSLASGSTAYRGQNSHTEAGAYSSSPNTSFFTTILSEASGSISYRGEKAHAATGAYGDSPNTSFFLTISSEASGSTAYRATSYHGAAGAYTDKPNEDYFKVITSYATGSKCYRAQNCALGEGAYSSAPNTSFFFDPYKSIASGSDCYRINSGQPCNTAAFAYLIDDKPNTSYFKVIESAATGTTCYRAEECHKAAGSYSSRPNTSFFIEADKSTSAGSDCYRYDTSKYGALCNTPAGAVEGTEKDVKINTSYFVMIQSSASGTKCYRGDRCNKNKGAYSVVPNADYFYTISSESPSHTVCYRGEHCAWDKGAYSSTPNTSFFLIVKSLASGSECYRGEGCNKVAGVYESATNVDENYFIRIESESTGTTCYRAQECALGVGAYSSSPNTSFFNTSMQERSTSQCYRGEGCRTAAGVYESATNVDENYFIRIESESTGVTCYRAQECALGVGAYSSSPNTSFFYTSMQERTSSQCYRGGGCRAEAYSYFADAKPDVEYFKVIESTATGVTCYRAEACNKLTGSYSSRPNTSFFIEPNKKTSAGSDCYRYDDTSAICNTPAGAVIGADKDVKINTSYFIMIQSSATGTKCYRGDRCNKNKGAYSVVPNADYFYTISSESPSHTTCYRGEHCAWDKGAYSSAPNTSFFLIVKSLASGSECYRGKGCNIYAYLDEPDTNYFVTIKSESTGKICYRAEACNITGGAYSSSPNTSFFTTSMDEKSQSQCYRGEDCNYAAGAYSVKPNTSYFVVTQSLSSGTTTTCYRCDACSVIADFSPYTAYFNVASSVCNSKTCYAPKGDDPCVIPSVEDPSTCFFERSSETINEQTCEFVSKSNFTTADINTNVFIYDASSIRITKGGVTKNEKGETITTSGTEILSYYPIGCNENNYWSTNSNKLTNCYFDATSKRDPGTDDDCRIRGENIDIVTCYKYTKPLWKNDAEHFGNKTYVDGTHGGTDEGLNYQIFTYTEYSTTSYTSTYSEISYTKTAYTVTGYTDTTYRERGGEGETDKNILTATYPNGCNADYGWYNASSNTEFFNWKYTSTSGKGNASSNCFDVKCHHAITPKCTVSTNEFTPTSGGKVTGADAFDITTVSIRGGKENLPTSNISATYADTSKTHGSEASWNGCNQAKGWYYSQPSGDYFLTRTVTLPKADNCGKTSRNLTCYQATACAISGDSNKSGVATQQIECFFNKFAADPQNPLSCSYVNSATPCAYSNYVYTTSTYTDIKNSYEAIDIYNSANYANITTSYVLTSDTNIYINPYSINTKAFLVKEKARYISTAETRSCPYAESPRCNADTSVFTTAIAGETLSHTQPYIGGGSVCGHPIKAYYAKGCNHENCWFGPTDNENGWNPTYFNYFTTVADGYKTLSSEYNDDENNISKIDYTKSNCGRKVEYSDKTEGDVKCYNSLLEAIKPKCLIDNIADADKDPEIAYIDTSRFSTNHSTIGTGGCELNSYWPMGCTTKNGWYKNKPNTQFFYIQEDDESRCGNYMKCYALDKNKCLNKVCVSPTCNYVPHTSIFVTEHKTYACPYPDNSKSLTCYKSTACTEESNNIDNRYFIIESKSQCGKSCDFAASNYKPTFTGVGEKAACAFNRSGSHTTFATIGGVSIDKSVLKIEDREASLSTETMASDGQELFAFVATGCDSYYGWQDSVDTSYFEATSVTVKQQDSTKQSRTCYAATGYKSDSCSIEPTDAQRCIYNYTSATAKGASDIEDKPCASSVTTYKGYKPTGCNSSYNWYNEDDITSVSTSNPSYTATSYFRYGTPYNITQCGNQEACYRYEQGCGVDYDQFNETVFSYAPITIAGGYNRDSTCTKDTITAHKPNSCQNSNRWYNESGKANETYFKNQNVPTDKCNSTVSCYKAYEARCSANTTYFNTDFTYAWGGDGDKDCSDISQTCNENTRITATWATSCNTQKGYHYPKNTNYFKYSSSSKYISKDNNCQHNAVRCYAATECQYATEASAPCWANVGTTTEKTTDEKICYYPSSCKYGSNSEYYHTDTVSAAGLLCTVNVSAICGAEPDTSIFTTSSVRETILDAGTSCFAENAYKVTGCKTANGYYRTSDVYDEWGKYFTFGDTISSTCAGKVDCKRCNLNNRQKCIARDSTGDGVENGQYFTWDTTAHTCRGYDAYAITGCNGDKGSFATAINEPLSNSNVSSDDLDDITSNPDKYNLPTGAYGDIFEESTGNVTCVGASYSVSQVCQSGTCTCKAKCSCNNDNGWYATPEATGSSDTVAVTSRRSYAFHSGDNGNTTETLGKHTCYHAKPNNCGNGYFYYDDPEKQLDSKIYEYERQDQSGSSCYKATGCASVVFDAPYGLPVEAKVTKSAVKEADPDGYDGYGNNWSLRKSTKDPYDGKHKVGGKVLRCYTPKWPTHVVYTYTTSSSGDDECYTIQNIKFYRGVTDVTERFTTRSKEVNGAPDRDMIIGEWGFACPVITWDSETGQASIDGHAHHIGVKVREEYTPQYGTDTSYRTTYLRTVLQNNECKYGDISQSYDSGDKCSLFDSCTNTTKYNCTKKRSYVGNSDSYGHGLYLSDVIDMKIVDSKISDSGSNDYNSSVDDNKKRRYNVTITPSMWANGDTTGSYSTGYASNFAFAFRNSTNNCLNGGVYYSDPATQFDENIYTYRTTSGTVVSKSSATAGCYKPSCKQITFESPKASDRTNGYNRITVDYAHEQDPLHMEATPTTDRIAQEKAGVLCEKPKWPTHIMIDYHKSYNWSDSKYYFTADSIKLYRGTEDVSTRFNVGELSNNFTCQTDFVFAKINDSSSGNYNFGIGFTSYTESSNICTPGGAGVSGSNYTTEHKKSLYLYDQTVIPNKISFIAATGHQWLYPAGDINQMIQVTRTVGGYGTTPTNPSGTGVAIVLNDTLENTPCKVFGDDYYDSVPSGMKCDEKTMPDGTKCYNECVASCKAYGDDYYDSIPSGKVCDEHVMSNGMTCYNNCREDEPCYFTIRANPDSYNGGSISYSVTRSGRIPETETYEDSLMGTLSYYTEGGLDIAFYGEALTGTLPVIDVTYPGGGNGLVPGGGGLAYAGTTTVTPGSFGTGIWYSPLISFDAAGTEKNPSFYDNDDDTEGSGYAQCQNDIESEMYDQRCFDWVDSETSRSVWGGTYSTDNEYTIGLNDKSNPGYSSIHQPKNVMSAYNSYGVMVFRNDPGCEIIVKQPDDIDEYYYTVHLKYKKTTTTDNYAYCNYTTGNNGAGYCPRTTTSYSISAHIIDDSTNEEAPLSMKITHPCSISPATCGECEVYSSLDDIVIPNNADNWTVYSQTITQKKSVPTGPNTHQIVNCIREYGARDPGPDGNNDVDVASYIKIYGEDGTLLKIDEQWSSYNRQVMPTVDITDDEDEYEPQYEDRGEPEGYHFRFVIDNEKCEDYEGYYTTNQSGMSCTANQTPPGTSLSCYKCTNLDAYRITMHPFVSYDEGRYGWYLGFSVSNTDAFINEITIPMTVPTSTQGTRKDEIDIYSDEQNVQIDLQDVGSNYLPIQTEDYTCDEQDYSPYDKAECVIDLSKKLLASLVIPETVTYQNAIYDIEVKNDCTDYNGEYYKNNCIDFETNDGQQCKAGCWETDIYLYDCNREWDGNNNLHGYITGPSCATDLPYGTQKIFMEVQNGQHFDVYVNGSMSYFGDKKCQWKISYPVEVPTSGVVPYISRDSGCYGCLSELIIKQRGYQIGKVPLPMDNYSYGFAADDYYGERTLFNISVDSRCPDYHDTYHLGP